MSETTIFKRIIDGEIPADIVYDDEHCLVFRDIKPQAPVHLLLIPKKEIASVDEISPEDAALLGHLWTLAPRIAADAGLEHGYRVIVNCGVDGGQEVPHLHFHILGGRRMTWPPG